MNALQDDVNKLYESRQKALEDCTAYHNKRTRLDADLDDTAKTLNKIKSDTKTPLAQKVAALKVSDSRSSLHCRGCNCTSTRKVKHAWLQCANKATLQFPL